MPLGKLIRTERIIVIYKKTNQKVFGEPVKEISVDNIPLNILKTIITPNEDDPFLYDGYILKKEELNKFNTLLENKIEPDYNKFEYSLECYGIYEKETQP
jgi:hypothetical protein